MSRLDQECAITKFPLPPSCNALFAPVNGRMVKTREYRSYDHEVTKWIITETKQLRMLREFVQEIDGYVLHVDTKFYMPINKIVCLNGKPKKNDTSNRIKALHDVISETVMGLDDSYFWSGSFSKEVLPKNEVGYVNLGFKLRLIS